MVFFIHFWIRLSPMDAVAHGGFFIHVPSFVVHESDILSFESVAEFAPLLREAEDRAALEIDILELEDEIYGKK